MKYLILIWMVFVLGGASAFAASDVPAAQAAIDRGDFAKAFAILEPMAAKGRPDALYLLGTLYANGDGVEADEVRAIRCFRAAASKGHKIAKQTIVLLYRMGPLAEPAPEDWQVILGTVPNEQAGEREWRRLVKAYPDLLTGADLALVPQEKGGKRVFQIRGTHLDEPVARAICADLAETVLSCSVAKPPPQPPAPESPPAIPGF
jgi:TPR repeat protein